MTRLTLRYVALLALTVLLAGSTAARANCNTIPQAGKDFHGALGFADRPFAGPGQFIELGLSPLACTTAQHAFPDCDGDGTTDVDELIVTLFFKPLGNGARHAAFIATDCDAIDTSADCGFGIPENIIPASQTICIDADAPGMDPSLYFDVQEKRLSVRFPSGICVGGDRPGLPCETDDPDCKTGGHCETAALPHPLTGPLTIAVTCAKPIPKLPCDLAGQDCKSVLQISSSSLKPDFCLDDIYSIDGACNVNQRHDVFPSFTALPPENDFLPDVCTYGPLDPKCADDETENEDNKVLFALDSRGDALVPIDWSGILTPPAARLAVGSTAVPPVAGAAGPIKIPRHYFAESYTRRGTRLPALFEPQVSPSRQNELTLFGTVDAEHSVLRVARRGRSGGKFWECSGGSKDGKACKKPHQCPGGGVCAQAICQGGAHDGMTCEEDEDCPGGRCGNSLFDFESRVKNGFGPVIITRAPGEGKICDESTADTPTNDGAPCIQPGDQCASPGVCCDYRADAGDHIPLGSVESSEGLHAFVLDEQLVQRDVNGDGDTDDEVLTVRDRPSGALLPIGVGSGCTPANGCPPDPACPGADGRAVVMLPRAGYEFPALSLGNEVIAFIEDCEATMPAPCDDVLRVYRKLSCSEPMLQEITTGDLTPAQDQVIDDWVLQVSEEGQVFFRDPCGVLQVLEGGGAPGSAPDPLAPATRVATAGAKAAFLLPEQPAPGPACSAPPPSQDLNGDGDLEDAVVHLWSGGSGPVEKLGCAATEVDMSSDWVGALVSERDQTTAHPDECPGPQGEGDLNGDGDCGDQVVHVAKAVPPSASDCALPTWRNLEQAGKQIGVSEGAVAYLRPESDEGKVLNADGDQDDDVMQVYFARKGKYAWADPPVAPRPPLPNEISVAAEGYVLGEPAESGDCHVLAFHTSESAQNANLNPAGGDADLDDEVLQLFELVTGEKDPDLAWQNTGQAVTECPWMICDPREPYQVEERSVRFLTDECKQGGPVPTACAPPPGGTDLDRDGAADRVVMQVLDACQEGLFPAKRGDDGIPFGPRTELQIASFGVDEHVESFAMAGRCVEELDLGCGRDAAKEFRGCPSGAWCEESQTRERFSFLPPGFRPVDTCHRDQGVCLSSEDCPAGLECQLDYTTVFFLGRRGEREPPD